jgi:hypothetical protein
LFRNGALASSIGYVNSSQRQTASTQLNKECTTIAGRRLPLRRLNSPATSPSMTALSATVTPTSK